MAEKGSGPIREIDDDLPEELDDDLPEELDDEAREWIHKVDKMNDEDAQKARLERSLEMEIRNAWKERYKEFLKELP